MSETNERIARIIDPVSFGCTPEMYATDEDGFKRTWAYAGQQIALKKARTIAALFAQKGEDDGRA